MATSVKYLPLLFASIANAELLSEHNEQHAAVQAALNRLYSAGCTRTETTRSGRFGLNDTEPGDYQITGVTLTVRCTQWPAPPVEPAPTIIIHDLTWSRPAVRTDDTPLQPDQISGYMLEIDGQMTFLGNVLRYEATYSVALPHVYRVATVDIMGRQGPWSHEVRL